MDSTNGRDAESILRERQPQGGSSVLKEVQPQGEDQLVEDGGAGDGEIKAKKTIGRISDGTST